MWGTDLMKSARKSVYVILVFLALLFLSPRQSQSSIGMSGAFAAIWHRRMAEILKGETVSQPRVPIGPRQSLPGEISIWFTGGSVDSLGSSVEYQFSWGDGTYSAWAAGTSASHSWAGVGTYPVTAQARSQTNAAVVSTASNNMVVDIP